jgi:hypothetical protein
MYEKLGYRICSHATEFSAAASTEPAALREVDGEEYCRLRRQFLPEGGVLQEGDSIRFLQSMNRFYAGEDFLVAIYKKADTYEKEVDSEEENTLYGIELLGNIRKAPGILYALGYKQGHFRAPGEEMPFAMYYGLKENGMIPTYFGLAFD